MPATEKVAQPGLADCPANHLYALVDFLFTAGYCQLGIGEVGPVVDPAPRYQHHISSLELLISQAATDQSIRPRDYIETVARQIETGEGTGDIDGNHAVAAKT